MRRSVLLAAVAASATVGGLVAPAVATPAPTTTAVVVTSADLGHGWVLDTTRGNPAHQTDGVGSFVVGPNPTYLGSGSFEMATVTSDSKVVLATTSVAGIALGAVDAVTYATYRDSSSTVSRTQGPSIQMLVCPTGTTGGSCSNSQTLVWESIYPDGNDAINDDVWQNWDALAPSNTTFHGGWWSTRAIGALGAYTYNSFAEVQSALPNAVVMAFGVGVGSGWAGTFTGYVDGLTLGVSGVTTTYDFEPLTSTPTFLSSPPSPASYGGTYAVATAGGGSSAPVVLGAGPAAVCTISGASVTFTGSGTCVVTADQAGDTTHLGGHAQQSVTVGAAPVGLSGSRVSVWGTLTSGKATFTVTATNTANGAPAAGVPVKVSVPSSLAWLGVPGVSCSATTNNSGLATCSIPVFTGVASNLSVTNKYQISSTATAVYQAATGTGQVTFF